MLLARIVETSQTVAATRSRRAKVVALAETLRDADAEDLPTVVAYLGGALAVVGQLALFVALVAVGTRLGVRWAGVLDRDPVPPPAPEAAQVVRPRSVPTVPVPPVVASPADVAAASVPVARASTTPVAVWPHASVTV